MVTLNFSITPRQAREDHASIGRCTCLKNAYASHNNAAAKTVKRGVLEITGADNVVQLRGAA